MPKVIEKEQIKKNEETKIAVCRQRYLRIAPRKIRFLIDAIRGENLPQAMAIIRNTNKAASPVVLKALKSAQANAIEKEMDKDILYIKEIKCDEGPAMKRQLPRSRGQSVPILKKFSHLTVVLGER